MMLKYLYTLIFEPASGNCLGLNTSVRVFVLAEKYMLDGMLATIGQTFYKIASENVLSDEFVQSVALTYQITQDRDSPLRMAIQKVCSENARILFKTQSAEEFRQMARETPGFAVDFAASLTEYYVPGDEFENMGIWKCGTKNCSGMRIVDHMVSDVYEECWYCAQTVQFYPTTKRKWLSFESSVKRGKLVEG